MPAAAIKEVANYGMPVWDKGYPVALAVTPDDNNDLPGGVADSLWIGGAGNVAVVPVGQATAVTFTAVAAGTRLPVRVSRVMSTNTTATLIIAMS